MHAKRMKKLMKPNLISNRTFWLMLGWLIVSMPAQAFYDPSLGRWLNRDPLGEPGHETGINARSLHHYGNAELLPEGSNLYGFVHNNPVAFYDADGRAVPIIIGGAGAAAIAAKVAAAFGLSLRACLSNPACRTAVVAAIGAALDKCKPKPRGRSPEEEEKRKECVRRCHEDHEDAHELSFCIRRCNGGWNSPPDRPTPPGPIR
jgi:RHS repeat-associated protein